MLQDSIPHKMLSNDMFSQWLGITIIDESPGSTELKMTVREEMTNGFKIAHGGITYAFADSAFAFASNSRGHHAVSIQTSINHHKAVYPGDELLAKAREVNQTRKTGVYHVEIFNQKKELVASFQGTVFKKDSQW